MDSDKLYVERLKKKLLHDVNNDSLNLYIGCKEMSDCDLKNINELSAIRNNLLKEYMKVLNILNPLVEEEHKLLMQINTVNKKICGIEGHKLDNDLFMTKEYGKTYKCVSCGALIGLDALGYKDTFIRDENKKYVRILYKK